MPAEPADQTLHKKQVKVAAWMYRTPEGNQRCAFFNDVVTLTAEEADRGEQMGVFTEIPAAPYPPPDMPFMWPATPGHEPEAAASLAARQAQPRF